MRIPGLATGMDTDKMIKEMMKPYQAKVDSAKQEQKIIEYKQEQYRDILKQSQDFYNKYLTVGSKDSVMSSSNWKTISFASSNSAAVTAEGAAGAKAENYKVTVSKIATSATCIIDDTLIKDNNVSELKIKMDGKDITFKLTDDSGVRLSASQIVEGLNKKFEENNLDIKVKKSDFYGGLELSTKATGEKAEFEINGTKVNGSNAEVEIEKNGVTKKYSLESNSLSLDGVTFKFNDVTGTEGARLTGKNDVSKTKDMIVGFINDYNKLIENINTKVLEKHNRNYKPLTDEQRKDMTEEEQKLWDKKAKEGLLRSDMYLRNIADSLKNTMRTALGGINLEEIGIEPVRNYNEKNGMFTIDESKLEKALEENPDKVRDLFLKEPTGDNPKTGGIFNQLKDTLFKETVSVSSPLMKKAGMKDSVTAFNNELTKTLQKKEKLIEQMQKDLITRENNYYSQFARLETQMNKLNSQNAYLMQQFGGGM